jgi:O-antigen/teichoic acid export membrane protein
MSDREKRQLLEAADGLSVGGHHRANLATTIASFCMSIVVGLWFTPYLVHSLGPAVYGLIPLATNIISLFSLLSQALSAVLTRRLTQAFGSNDHATANYAFGIALTASLILCVVLLVPLVAVAALSPKLFKIPDGMQTETQILFGVTAATLLLGILGTSFTAVPFSRNQIYLSNIAALIQSFCRVVLTVVIFAVDSARILYAALAILISAMVSLGFNIVFAKHSVPWLRFRGFAYDRNEFRAFYRTATHQLLMNVGSVVIMSCEVVVVNRLFGAYDGGRYAAVTQWLMLLRNATIALVVLFLPTILSLYARHDFPRLVRYVQRAMRWTGICIALPVGYLCGLSPQILRVWLGPEFSDLWPIMCAQLPPLIVVSSILPLYTVSLAADRVLLPGVVHLLTALVGIGMALLVTHAGAGMIAVAVCVGWSVLAKELVFMPLYIAGILRYKPTTFYPPLVQGVTLFFLVLAGAFVAGQLFVIDNYFKLGIVGFGIGILFGLAALAVMSDEDRKILFRSLTNSAAPS